MPKFSTREILESLCFGDSMFRTLSNVEPLTDSRGIRFVAGREGIVVAAEVEGKRVALKCYTRPNSANVSLFSLLDSIDSPLLAKPQFLPQELWMGNCYTDITLYPWIEGETLEWTMRYLLHNHFRERLADLLGEFRKVALQLLEAEWRHGDLKPENIIVTPDGSLRLIDCDSIYHPTLPSRGHTGTPPFVHRSRGDAYDSHIDDYSIALIITSLAAHLLDQTLPADKTLITLPTEGFYPIVAPLFDERPHLKALLDALYSSDYKIDQLHNHILNLDV